MKPKNSRYKSGFEVKIAKSLEQQGVVIKYEETKLKYKVPAKDRNYIPDFELPNGIFVEGKGKLDRDTREKMALVIEQNPDKDIRFLFMRDNKLSRVSKTRYSDWCDKRGIKYAISEAGNVPEAWILLPPRDDSSGSSDSIERIESLDPHQVKRKPRTKKDASGSLSDGRADNADVQE